MNRVLLFTLWAGGFAKGGELWVEEFGGEASRERLDGFALLWGEAGEALGGAGQLGFADGFSVLLEGEDGGDGVARLKAFLVLVYFPADDGFGGGGFAAAIGEVGCGDLLEVVDVVDETAFDFVHAWIHVAGDGDVDEEHGAVAATVKELPTMGAFEDFLRGSGAGDDDVGAGALFVEGVEGDGFGMDGGTCEVGGNLLGTGFSAVGNEDRGCAVLNEMAGGEFGHLARAYEEDGFSL